VASSPSLEIFAESVEISVRLDLNGVKLAVRVLIRCFPLLSFLRTSSFSMSVLLEK